MCFSVKFYESKVYVHLFPLRKINDSAQHWRDRRTMMSERHQNGNVEWGMWCGEACRAAHVRVARESCQGAKLYIVRGSSQFIDRPAGCMDYFYPQPLVISSFLYTVNVFRAILASLRTSIVTTRTFWEYSTRFYLCQHDYFFNRFFCLYLKSIE